MYQIDKLVNLQIGVQGENIATDIEVDMTTWAEKFPDALFYVLFKPYNEDYAFPVVSDYDSETHVLTWHITFSATSIVGVGYTEIRAVDSDVGLVKKTRIIPTVVEHSVSGLGTDDPPEPYEDWVNTVLAAKDTAVAAKDTAVDSKEAAETARDAAQAAAGDFQGLTATATGLAAGSDPTVNVTHSEGGLYNMAFGIPKGEKGETGDPAPSDQVVPAVNSYLSQVITNPDSPPLDRTLASANAAAPADMVGDLKSAIEKQAEVISTEDVFAGLLSDTSGTSNGVTYTLNGNTLTMSGTTSAASVFVWYAVSPVPDFLKGKIVFVHINTTGEFTTLLPDASLFGIRYKTSEITTYTNLIRYINPGIYALQIPSDVTALQFRTVLLNPCTVNGTVNVEIMPAYDFDAIFDEIQKTYFTNRGEIPTGSTKLSDLMLQGVYYIPFGKISTLTDLPDGYENNRNSIMLCYPTSDNVTIQVIYQWVSGYIWARIIDVSIASVGAWSSATATKYLSRISNGDADNVPWTGWYGWGSTESVSNVPSTVGMLLNVVRLAATKYQLAFDYFTGAVLTRNSKNSVWTDWKRLAFASEIPSNPKSIYIKYESGSFAGGAATERLHIYVPTVTGYILYLMYHFVDTSNNSDVWQIYNANQVNDDFDYANRKTLTITGEWECAIHLSGRDDFSGGHTHGDEMLQSVVFLMDGVPVTISDFTTLTPCTELRIIRASTMYDPADHTTAITEHGVEYVYTSDGVTIEQSLKWLVAEQLTNCFLCMFLPSKNCIDRAFANSDFAIETLPSETGTPLTTVTKPKSTGVTMWDTASGMFANVSVPVYPTGLTGGDKMTIHDNSNKNYNKIYFYICTGGTSSVGELWKSKSVYKIGYKAAT